MYSTLYRTNMTFSSLIIFNLKGQPWLNSKLHFCKTYIYHVLLHTSCPTTTTIIQTLYIFNKNNYKTSVINDPLGQTHSHASSEHCFLLFCFSRFEKWRWMDGRHVRKQWSLPAVTLGWPSGSTRLSMTQSASSTVPPKPNIISIWRMISESGQGRTDRLTESRPSGSTFRTLKVIRKLWMFKSP